MTSNAIEYANLSQVEVLQYTNVSKVVLGHKEGN